MPVSEDVKKTAEEKPEKPASKEDDDVKDTGEVDLVDVKEDDSYKLPSPSLLTQIQQDDQSGELKIN
jgi:DNA segregation ATPase FtsK/SpoIIIE, S-DNA-T family